MHACTHAWMRARHSSHSATAFEQAHPHPMYGALTVLSYMIPGSLQNTSGMLRCTRSMHLSRARPPPPAPPPLASVCAPGGQSVSQSVSQWHNIM